MKRIFTTALVALTFAGSSAFAANPFPRPAELEPDVRFWTRVYSEVSTNAGLIHDSRHLAVVYQVMEFPKGLSRRARQNKIDRTKRHYKGILERLARGKRSNLTADESRVLRLWPDGVANETLRGAARHLRFQLGQADKFRAGLVRSGAWEPHIRETFEKMGLPIELAALPHVESSYTPHAYSRVGAAGLWQFTRSTGRRFMRVDHVVDERLDPYRATVAAARLLEQNRQTTGAWPLAITAYNHGAAGMRRAVKQLGTRDIAIIARKYKGRTFGFASRNFYVEFLAAADVDFHSERYFGPLLMDAPIDYETVELPFYTRAATLQRALGIDRSTLKGANPGLRDSVWAGAKYIPKGYLIRVPRAELPRPMNVAVADIPDSERFAGQIRDSFHTVRRGDTLSGIARRYGLRMSEISGLNGLRSRHRIRVGQKLRLPDATGRTRTVAHRPVAKSVTPTAPPADGVYRVRRGDNITTIARRFGVDEAQIIRSNNLRNRNRIYVGQKLRLSPAPAAPAAPPPPPASHPDSAPALSEVVTAKAPAPEPPAEAPAAGVAATDPQEPQVAAVETAEVGEAQALSADPNDYSVDGNGKIEVQGAETLGHYAEWLGVRASRLRKLNGLRYGQPVAIGRRLRLDFSQRSEQQFEEERLAYHRALQGEFFQRFQIDGTKVHVMRRGDSLWTLAQRTYRVPLWLIRQYNPDLDFASLQSGTRITIPLVKRHAGTTSGVDPAAAPGSSEARVRPSAPGATSGS